MPTTTLSPSAAQDAVGLGGDVTGPPSHEHDLAYADRLRTALSQGVVEIVSAPGIEASLPRALQIVGEAMGADRVLVFEDNETPGGPVKLIDGWVSPALNPPLDKSALRQSLRRTADVTEWPEVMGDGGPAIVSFSTATGGMQQVLKIDGAKTILVAPILVAGRRWGHVAADDCKTERSWTKAEIDTLTTFAEIAGASILRERRQQERARAEHALTLASQNDALTGLASRKLFGERLERAIAQSAGRARGFAVHYVDLDHFKDVNDTRGHPVGDLLLQAVAERLRALAGDADVVARFGGDEFAVLQFGVGEPDDAGALARRILEGLKEPFHVGGHELHIGGSIGIALYDAGSPDPEALLSHAELALYRAKADGRRTYRFFTAAMDAEARRRATLTDELRKALNGGEFFLLYQPQVEIGTGRMTGMEALARWRHPTRGLVSPSEFIPAAESNGLILQLGEWILRAACWQAEDWIRRGLPRPTVAVNISAVQFRRPGQLEDMIGAIVRDADLPPGCLRLELTETALMEASMAQADVLDRLHRQGLKISLDDFGTGYSSLEYLHRYPVDQIKIAQTFVTGMMENPGDVAIIKATIGLAQAFGVRVLAEGVERREQAELLAQWGCDEAQGFYYSRPVPPEQMERFLRDGVPPPSDVAA